MPGSKIAVEITANSSELQAAVTKASESLRNLAKVVADTSASSTKSGETIAKANQKVAESFTTVGKVAGDAATKTKVATGEMATATEASATRIAASAKKIETGFGAAHSSITKAGKNISLALVGVAGAGLYMAAKFQQATTQFNTQAGASLAQTKKLRDGILDMAASVGQTPDQLAGGMYHVVSSLNNLIPAAQRTRVELGVLKAAAEGAAVGNSNMTETTYALSGVMNALGQKTIPQAQRTMAELNAIVGAGDMHMQDFVNAMSTGIVPAARTFGVSLKSMGAAMDVLTDSGIPAEQAATRLRMGMTMMAAPTKMATGILQTLGLTSKQAISDQQAMAATLEKAGVSTTQLAADMRQPDGFLVALQDLKSHLEAAGLSAEGAGAVISRAFGGARSGTAIEALYNNLAKLQGKFKQVGDTTDTFGAKWKQTQETLIFQWHQVEAAVESFLVRIGSGLTPVVEGAITVLRSMVDWLGQNKTAAEVLGGAIGVLGSVAIASFVTARATAFVGSVGKMLGSLKAFSNWLLTGTLERNTATAMAGTEAAVVAAEPKLATAASADGAAIGRGLLSGVARVFTAAAITVLVAEALKGPLQQVSSTIHNALGAGFGGGVNVPTGLNLSQQGAQKYAQQFVNQFDKQNSWAKGTVTTQQVVAALQRAGDIKGQAATGGTVGGVNQGMQALGAGGPLTSQKGWEVAVLQGVGAPVNKATLSALAAWSNAEGPWGKVGLYNQLGVTMSEGQALNTNPRLAPAGSPSASDFNSNGGYPVLNFANPAAGTQALIAFLKSRTPGVVSALRSGNSAALSTAVTAAGWGTEPFGGSPTPSGFTPGNSTPGGVVGTTNTAAPAGQSGFYNAQNNTYGTATKAQQQAIIAEWRKANGGAPYPTSPAALFAFIKKQQPSTSSTPTTQAERNAVTDGNVWAALAAKGGSGLGSMAAATGKSSGSSLATYLLTTLMNVSGHANAAGLGASLNASGLAKQWTGVANTIHGESTAGQGILGGLRDAVQSGSLSSLTTVLNDTHTRALGTLVEKLDATHNKQLVALGAKIEAVYQKAVSAWMQAKAWATLSAGNTAFNASSSSAGTLYNAGVTLGINTPGQAATAQEAPLSGITGGALSAALPGFVQALEGGGLTSAQYLQYAGVFGGNNSELGSNLLALGSGTLSATGQASALDAIYTLIGSLTGLSTTVADNTQTQTTLLSLYQQQNTSLSQEVRTGAVQANVIRGMIPQIPHFATGGPVVDDGLIYAHRGEYVVTRSEAGANGWGQQPQDVNIHQHYHGDAAALMSIIDQRIQHPDNVRMVSQRIGQRTNQLRSAPGGFR